jgi:dipeptidyl aminopeptidase/acylaminoacyl peptidase
MGHQTVIKRISLLLLLSLCWVACTEGSVIDDSQVESGTATVQVTTRTPTTSQSGLAEKGETPVEATPIAAVVHPETEIQKSPTLTPTAPGEPHPSTTFEEITTNNATQVTQISEVRFDPWDLVLSLAWSPDGKIIALSSAGSVHLYEVGDLEPLASLNIGALTHSLAFSSDGDLLAAGSRDGFMRVWKLADLVGSDFSAHPIITAEAHKKGVTALVFSPSDRLLATGGNDAVARLWDIDTGENIETMIGGTYTVPAIAFSPDGGVLAVVNGDVVRLREVGAESIVGSFLSETPLYSIAFSPDGDILAVGDINNQIRLWDPDEAFRTGVDQYPDPVILSGHNGAEGGDGTIRLWDIANGESLITLTGFERGVTCVGFNPDGRILASGSLDGTLRLWGIEP